MTVTSDLLTASQMQELRAVFDRCAAKLQTATGAWTEAYELLYGFLTTTNALGYDSPREGVDDQSWLW